MDYQKLWKNFINEIKMYHSTSPENIDFIKANGLIVGKSSAHTQAGEWADEYYGVRPVYLSISPKKYSGAVFEVEVNFLDLVSDLPSLIDHGAYLDSDSEVLYWEEGTEPNELLPYMYDGQIEIFDFLNNKNVIKAAIMLTGTAAHVGNIDKKNIKLDRDSSNG